MWKVNIKSKTNSKFVYEIPIVYINSDSSDKEFVTKYRNIENKLKNLDIIQFQETSACNLNFQNAVAWKLKLQNKQSGEFSETEKINTQGVTYLNAEYFSKNKLDNFDGRYSYVGDRIINDENDVIEYSEVDGAWKLKSFDRKETLSRNFKNTQSVVCIKLQQKIFMESVNMKWVMKMEIWQLDLETLLMIMKMQTVCIIRLVILKLENICSEMKIQTGYSLQVIPEKLGK